MPDDQTMYEVLDDSGTTIGNVDLRLMRTAIANYTRVIDHLKQEVQQLRGQVQRVQNQVKVLETRVARR
jgi:hypothetical protein